MSFNNWATGPWSISSNPIPQIFFNNPIHNHLLTPVPYPLVLSSLKTFQSHHLSQFSAKKNIPIHDTGQRATSRM